MAARQILYSNEAMQELHHAFEYYESKKVGLGAKFLQVFDKEVQNIALQPKSRQIIKDNLRKGVVRKFGYVLFMNILKQQILSISLRCFMPVEILNIINKFKSISTFN